MTSTQIKPALIDDHRTALQKYSTALESSRTNEDPKLLVALETLRVLHENNNFFNFDHPKKFISEVSWLHFNNKNEATLYDAIEKNFPERIFVDTTPEPYLFIGENALSYVFKLNRSSKTVDFCWLDKYEYEVNGVQEVNVIRINKLRHARELIEITHAANKANMVSYVPNANLPGKYIRAKVIEVISSHRSWFETYAYDCLKDPNVCYYDKSGGYSAYLKDYGWHLHYSFTYKQSDDIIARVSAKHFIANSENFSKTLGNYYSSESLPKKANALDVKCYAPFKEAGKEKKPPIPTNCPSVDLAPPKDILKILQDLQMEELKTLGVIFLQENTHQTILDNPYIIFFQKIDDKELVLNMAIVEGCGLVIKTFEFNYRNLSQIELQQTFDRIKQTSQYATKVDKQAEDKLLEDLKKANIKLLPLEEHRNWCTAVTFYKYSSKAGLNCYLYSLGSESNKTLHFVGSKTYEEILTPELKKRMLNTRNSLQNKRTEQELNRNTYSPSTPQIIAYYNHVKYVNSDKKYDEYKQRVLKCLEKHSLPLFNFVGSSNSNPYAFCVEYNNSMHEFWAESNEVFKQCLFAILLSQSPEETIIDKFCFQIDEFTQALEPKGANLRVFME